MVVDDRLIALSVREGQVLLLFKKQAPAHLQPGAHDLQIWLTDQNEGVKVAARLKLLS